MQEAAQGMDPAFAVANRGLSVIHRRKNISGVGVDKSDKKSSGGENAVCLTDLSGSVCVCA
jgi:hypothetical protein